MAGASRVDHHRRAALERLLGDAKREHLSAGHILKLLATQGCGAARSTVYRDLDALSRAGHISQTVGLRGERFYERRTEAHHHLLCRSCGRLEDLPSGVLPEGYACALTARAEARGWRLLPLRFTLTGRCPDCARERLVVEKGRGS